MGIYRGARFFFVCWSGSFLIVTLLQEHMLMGTVKEHSVFVQESESIFEQVLEFYMSHVHFKLHEKTT